MKDHYLNRKKRPSALNLSNFFSLMFVLMILSVTHPLIYQHLCANVVPGIIKVKNFNIYSNRENNSHL